MSDRVPCPRCGYDLHGIVDSWKESCPLHGVCTECGLELSWSEAIHPEKLEPSWCVEFSPRRRSLPAACVKTFVRSLWPWTFWSRLLMAHPVRGRRLALYACVLLVPVALLYIVVQASVALHVRSQVEQRLAAWRNGTVGRTTHLQNMYVLEQMTAETRADMFRDDPDLAQEYEDYEEWTLPHLPDTRVESRESYIRRQRQRQRTIDHSHLEAVVEAVFLPMRGSSWGSLVDPNGVARKSYVAPARLWREVRRRRPPGTRYSRVKLRSTTLLAARLGGSTIALILFPISFLLLPVSRKQAKVRWAHIWRVFVYSLIIPTALVWIVLLLIVPVLFTQWSDVPNWLAHRVAPFGAWGALALWWAVAIKRYLRMPHATTIAVLMTLMLSLFLTDSLLQIIRLLGLYDV